ncbi:hypothetical protein [Rhizobium sp. KDH_Rht_773_N]
MILIIWLVVALVCAFIGAGMARTRNRNTAVWGILCFLFGLVGIILLALVGQGSPGAAAPQVVHQKGPDMARWKTLTELDPDIASAATSARAAGLQYEQALAEKYLILNDKQYLASALAKVLEQAEQDRLAPPTGTVGSAKYKRNADGTYMVTSGRHVGRTFATFDDMKAALS